MDWGEAIQCVGASAVEIRRRPAAFDVEVKALLTLLEREDVLVAFATKEELQKLLSDKVLEPLEADEFVKALMTGSSAVWRRESGGFRFQLLRQLITMENGRDNGDSSGKECGDSGDEEERPGGAVNSYIRTVLENLAVVGATVRYVCVPTVQSEGGEGPSTSARHEALVFLSDFMRHLQSLDIEGCSRMVVLSQLMMTLVEKAFTRMDYASQPSFVSCAVLDAVTDFHKLLTRWKDHSEGDEGETAPYLYSEWLERCLVWLHQSSCTSEAFRLLGANGSSNVASEAAFISDRGQYPFLQQWLLCISHVGVALLDDVNALRLAEQSNFKVKAQLPTRRELFMIISEQDDVMIEVLNALIRIAAIAKVNNDSLGHISRRMSPFIERVVTEYDPDLLFADLVDILGRDHLVLLDLLVSNETRMLEYFMQHLRHMNTNWDTTKIKLANEERLQGVVSVLIRLRLEIDRLVGAGLFPYNAKPLTRRLLAIEHLYEQPEVDLIEQV